MKNVNEFSHDEKSLLLYLEDRAVNNSGIIDSRHMSANDFNIALNWYKEKYIIFKRRNNQNHTYNTHSVILTDSSYNDASSLRKEIISKWATIEKKIR